MLCIPLLQEENRSAVDRQWALCVFDDLIEFAAEVGVCVGNWLSGTCLGTWLSGMCV